MRGYETTESETFESPQHIRSPQRPLGSTGDTLVSHSADGDRGTAVIAGGLSWMSEGLDPDAVWSAGSSLFNRASVILGLLNME